MELKDIDKFFDNNRAELRKATEERAKKLSIAAMIIFPVNIILLIICIVGGQMPALLFVLSVMAVIGYFFYTFGYNAAQEDNKQALETFITRFTEFKKAAEKKKENK